MKNIGTLYHLTTNIHTTKIYLALLMLLEDVVLLTVELEVPIRLVELVPVLLALPAATLPRGPPLVLTVPLELL